MQGMTFRMRAIWSDERCWAVEGWERKGSRMEDREEVSVYFAIWSDHTHIMIAEITICRSVNVVQVQN